jgi:hypothetical protein
VIQFAQDLSLRFEMTDYLACHFERIARNLSSLYGAIHSNPHHHHHPPDPHVVRQCEKSIRALRQCSGQTAKYLISVCLPSVRGEPRRVVVDATN